MNNAVRSNLLAIGAGLSMFTLMLLGDQIGVHEYFWATLLSITALSFAVWENRSYHHEPWFWISLAVFLLLHVMLISAIARYKVLTRVHGYDARGLLAIALVDAVIMTAVIRFPDWVVSSLNWFFGDSNVEGTVAK